MKDTATGKEYRMLVEGEIPRVGDEKRPKGNTRWVEITFPHGHGIHKDDPGEYRRPLTQG